jgi:superfamily I DNA/RNA helicase
METRDLAGILHRVPRGVLRKMAEDLLEEHEALIHLTGEQGLLLARMGRTPRLAVTGCAGSGKTMLAVEHARRLARADTKVLFVCFNRGLAEYVRARETKSGIVVQTFHGICHQLARKAKLKLPQYEQGKAPPEHFALDLPNALVNVVEKLGPQKNVNDDRLTVVALGSAETNRSVVKSHIQAGSSRGPGF